MKEIDSFLEEWRNKESETEYSYIRYKYNEETESEIDFEEELNKILKTLKIKNIWVYVGGFESPGYEISCESLSIITPDGELVVYPLNFESY
jgi:hypothetical protein